MLGEGWSQLCQLKIPNPALRQQTGYSDVASWGSATCTIGVSLEVSDVTYWFLLSSPLPEHLNKKWHKIWSWFVNREVNKPVRQKFTVLDALMWST